MKLTIGTAHELISSMRSYFQVNHLKEKYTYEEPLRAELFSADQMYQFGKSLAETHELSAQKRRGTLLNRLADNERVLNAVRKILAETIKKTRAITPAGEWLIDNFYLIEEQIRIAKKHLPRGYSERLPQLANTDTRGITRVYDIALEIISHSDGQIDLDRLNKFINSYQSVSILQLGELWAIPIMLRLTLIENLRRVSALIAIDMIDKNLADYWAQQMLQATENDPKSLILVTADMARSNPPMVTAFVSEINRQLLGKGPALALPLNWIEQRLNEEGRTSSELVNAEIQKQAINQVSVSNSIGSLRLLSSLDWRDFVETNSYVEKTLHEDRSSIYGKMDFPTRDKYRHVVESIAKKSKLSENEVAKIAVNLSRENTPSVDADTRKEHVGYYLVDKGIEQLKKIASGPNQLSDRLSNLFGNNRLLVYLGSIILITLGISVSFLAKAYSDSESNWLMAIVTILLILSSSQLAITLVNFFSTLLIKPSTLPRMDFSRLIPEEYSTLVVVPSMLTDTASIEELVESLEVRFLANRDNNLYFGLLTDFKDASQQTLAEDDSLLLVARKGIEALKKKYETNGTEIFFLFHRPRQWNAKDKVWMGYERKRGKIAELNCLLRGGCLNRFSCTIGNVSLLTRVKYVITLDSDTQLPRGSAWKMIATLAHPLNHAFYDTIKKRVTRGYGILQPRVTVSLPESNSSFYSRLHGNEPGIDPYTRATSDVYQDLFGEGSFIGKGIYDIDVFEKALKGKFRENNILSHDLLEGCNVRSGLLSDVELFEKYPMSYRLDMKRRSRWIRGDWQIFSWFLPFVKGTDKKRIKNPISLLSRWKILDNIRRSLIPFALTILIVLGWTVLTDPLFWTIAVSGIIVLPIFVTLLWDAFKKPEDVMLLHHVTLLLRTTGNIVVQTLFTVICLPYEALLNLKAILRTLWRMLISHKKLLEWDPSKNIESSNKNSVMASYSRMWISPLLAIGLFVYLICISPFNLIVAFPILLLWINAPFVTWIVSKPTKKQKAQLTEKQEIFLLKIARKTWSFFEHFVGAEDNWLPPDNFQEHPTPVVAHRTSPTNIGLSLLANLSAYDFGYISVGTFLDRTARTIETMQKMERYRGHFYNWYDTQSLEPLNPKYISTVDSGNLAGHLLTLRQGLFEVLHGPIARPKIFEGLRDTITIISELIKKDETSFSEFTAILQQACTVKPAGIDSIRATFKQLSVCFENNIRPFIAAPGSPMAWWKGALENQLKDAINDMEVFNAWTLLPNTTEKFNELAAINIDISLPGLLDKISKLLTEIENFNTENKTIEEIDKIEKFRNALLVTKEQISNRIAVIEKLGHECIGLADMDWNFLYDKAKHLLTIGYRVDGHVCDPGFYDLLASEARLCVFVAIAQGKLPEDSWFALGRLLTKPSTDPILLSWSGSMFEYLMPLLVMPTYENTLLDQTYRATVKRQIEYGKQRGVPWGISESGYNMVDASSNYQYMAFGVPGLGLKRGLEADLVIAPYATILSLMVAPELSCQNLEVLEGNGFLGDYGFYEAIDYTPSRLQRGQSHTVIQSFMAHHQGMNMLALAYLMLDQPMQRRFEAEPQFQATVLLLQERVPKSSSFYAHTTEIIEFNNTISGTELRTINTPNTPIPEVQLLSNGKYHVMLTNAGGGYSKWKEFAVTRWRPDTTCDNWGTFCYIRDTATGEFWSNTHQPTLKKGKTYEAAFSLGRVDFHNSVNNIETHTEIVISPEDDIEMRRLHLTNKSGVRRNIEITSYAEVVLATPGSDLMQPAFSNLFVQTETLDSKNAIICTRRPRSAEEHSPWMFHAMIIDGVVATDVSYETDRMEFIGYGNSVANPNAMKQSGRLSGKQGSVLDPIVSIRHEITLEPEQSISVNLILGACETRETCERLIEKYQDKHHKNRVFELAWTHNQVILRQMNATEVDAQLYSRLAGSMIFSNPALRADHSVIIKNRRGQSGLWGYSISGDLPILLLQIQDQQNIQLAKQLIQAHTYWRLKGLIVDLVIWNEDHSGYRQAFQNQIQALIPNELIDRPGGVFVRAADQISNEDRILFQTVARVNICDTNGTLADQIKHRSNIKSTIPYFTDSNSYLPKITSILPTRETLLFNGHGGFSLDGTEYIITIDNKKRTPLPWVNVIANPDFGTVISESGNAYTWVENAHEMRLTPWKNDIVSDPGGEIFYLRDEETGNYWSTTALPKGGQSSYITRHGFGYSVFEHIEEDIHSEMTVYVDIASPVKLNVIKLRNDSGRPRRISATGYIEWILGDTKSKTEMFIMTEIDPQTNAFFARNTYNTEFLGRVAFFDVDITNRSFTADRTEFIGRNGSMYNPDAMRRLKLSGKLGVALDPCIAIQLTVDLGIGEEKEIIFRLGAGKDINNAREIVNQFRGADAAHVAFEKVKNYWKQTIRTVQVETPDIATNLLANGWLTYQTISSRLWGRTGYYQSSGAFGFRDQLQDVLSLLHTHPKLARKQIMLAASRQFPEGDVQHWWHPPIGQGVRTHMSDDYLWLPFVTSRYILHTGDNNILNEKMRFLEGRLLNVGEESYYAVPTQSEEQGTLFEHCVKAIQYGLKFGVHGLPLMGTGDWNDGMDRVGIGGKGESVWLAFFLYDVLVKFVDIANIYGDMEFATRCKNEAGSLQANIEKNGWDGNWYRRAYFDDGTPLGSATNIECQIDSISQSWSVLSGAGEPKRTVIAMNAVGSHLVNNHAGLIQLLDPPFDKANIDPGYIKGYVPGVRENGGQYTHAAIWSIMAFAKLGDNKRTWELLQMINPLNHGKSETDIAVYQVEPYVMAADVYAIAPHTGRGGWTWYTGAAGWMYQLIIESFLGLKRRANTLSFAPCIPPEWASYKARYIYQSTIYRIVVEQFENTRDPSVTVDGILQADNIITLIDDGKAHDIDIVVVKK